MAPSMVDIAVKNTGAVPNLPLGLPSFAIKKVIKVLALKIIYLCSCEKDQ